MNFRKFLRVVLFATLAIALAAGLCFAWVWWYFHPDYKRIDGTVYGARSGEELTFDRMRPESPNGLGILLIVSGGWHSSKGGFQVELAAPFLRRGYTVFVVYHKSQPEATVMDIVEDMHQAVRFIRHHADEYGIDPDRLGVTGGSSGGHLSLMLATRGGDGPLTFTANEVLGTESSAVQAVAVFCPVTDLLNMGDSTENLGDGGPPKSFVAAFGPHSRNLAVWKEIGRGVSPIDHVSADLPPVLILHGDRDTLVPFDQSTRFQARAEEAGARVVKVVTCRGKPHSWPGMLWEIRRFARWFDTHLRAE